MAASGTTEEVLQSLIDTLDLCAEKIKGALEFICVAINYYKRALSH